MINTIFYRQAELLLRILPLVNQQKVFALKGGTAINFFVRDLPRLSVDIDLTYLPVNERNFALKEISSTLVKISEEIQRRIPGSKIVQKKIRSTNTLKGIVVNQEGITVKVEPNLVLRGSAYPTEIKTLSRKAQDLFELSVRIQTLCTEELYAGKICAALDRQHPRDLFDIQFLINNEELTDKVRRGFIVYLISHPRPMIEILNPQLKDIRDVFEKEFKEMLAEELTYDELYTSRDRLIKILQNNLTMEEKEFIVSVKEGQPKWDLLALEGIEDLPAVKWKLLNIGNMDRSKHQKAAKKLRDYLGV